VIEGWYDINFFLQDLVLGGLLLRTICLYIGGGWFLVITLVMDICVSMLEVLKALRVPLGLNKTGGVISMQLYI